MDDIFDVKGQQPEQPKQPEQPTQAQATQDSQAKATQDGRAQTQGGQYIMQNITPMFPGWFACYDDRENPGETIMFPIIGLALVLMVHPDGRKEQLVRHLVSTPASQIDDVADFPGFICVLAPGQSPDAIVPAMRQMRNAAS